MGQHGHEEQELPGHDPHGHRGERHRDDMGVVPAQPRRRASEAGLRVDLSGHLLSGDARRADGAGSQGVSPESIHSLRWRRGDPGNHRHDPPGHESVHAPDAQAVPRSPEDSQEAAKVGGPDQGDDGHGPCAEVLVSSVPAGALHLHADDDDLLQQQVPLRGVRIAARLLRQEEQRSQRWRRRPLVSRYGTPGLERPAGVHTARQL
mmetsp:Transcript_48034/g.126853  ORF Transcript_48034/g.126853 Transcript_48034/m.126853 type:complete len:206 (+) Transcript_48034:395-1012(+)